MFLILLVCIATVLWFTVLNRSNVLYTTMPELFWSYKKWFAGNSNLGREIMANIAMFVPFGFLLSAVLPSTERTKKVFAVLAGSFLFSLLIESLQFFLLRGLYEWDDLISNTAGAAMGLLLYLILEKLLNRHFQTVIISISMIFVAGCLAVYVHEWNDGGAEADQTSKAYCFQIDEAEISDHTLTLTGFTFRYEQKPDRISLVLRSDAGDRVMLNTEYGTARPDVNDYFLCDYDYTNCGFTATGTVKDTEYEIWIQWPWSVSLPTGVFVSSSGIHYVPEKEYAAPSIEADFIESGTMRVYRPDFHCWVYQYEGDLYWVVDSGFNFEEDATTYIQYQIWTTQFEKLPEMRLRNQYYWDNIGGYFEDYELTGDWGEYRIMKRELPTAYSVKSIVTGYHKDEKWIWKEYFRPVYVLDSMG